MSAGGSSRARRAVAALSILVIVASVVVIARALPVDAAVARLRGWAEGQGALGLVAFGAVYVVAGLALVPGSALTLAAGAVYGVGVGLALVSAASTTTAALAFLIARHLARERVERRAERSPRFSAVDRAIGEQGWKVVALLRLSPALPFSLSNYLYGLTAVRFGPYLLASWAGMLPGTLLYVMLGDAGAAGLRAASGGDGIGTARLVLLGVGLVATVAVTVIVTRAARRALAERGGIDAPPDGDEEAPRRESAARWLLPAGALLATGLAALSWTMRERAAALFDEADTTEETR